MIKNGSFHRFEVLDALRGVAAFVVLAHHLEQKAGYGTTFFEKGYLAVDLFFMLSGFVVCYRYERDLQRGMSFPQFAVRRLVRLYPIILLGMTLGLLAFLIRDAEFPYWPYAFAAQMLFIPWPGGQEDLYFVNGAQWSLLFELLVNFVFALTIYRMSNRAISLIIAVSSICLVFTAFHFGTLGVGWSFGNAWGAIPRTGFGFLVGVLACRLWLANRGRRLELDWMIVLALATSALLLASNWGLKNHWSSDVLFVLFVFPPLLWLAACSHLYGKARAVGSLLGVLSYPVYALQGPIRLIGAEMAGRPVVQSAALVAGLALAVIVGSYVAQRCVDDPIQQWFRTWRTRKVAA